MRTFIISLLILTNTNLWGQIDTNWTQYQLADYVYGNLNAAVPTQKLFNRTFIEDTLFSVAWNTNEIMKDTTLGANSDHVYTMLYELKLMSSDTVTVPDRLTVFDAVYSYMGKIEFDDEQYHYPIGIMDYKFNVLDEEASIANGSIYLQDSAYHLASNNLVLTEKNATLIAPLFDNYDSEVMAVVFKKEFFLSNYRSVDDISSIFLRHNLSASYLTFDQTYYFTPDTTENQTFYVEITYTDNTILKTFFTIHTPFSAQKKNESKSSSFAGCTQEGEIDIDDNKLKWCLVSRCGYNGRIFKPYILITGYRPPIFGQSFEKTWQIYNDEHHSLLNSLRDNNYDVFLVKFNIHVKPYKHGMAESAVLLEKFIIWVNTMKGAYSGQENVIQGNSMGSDIARLTLLTMEKKHFENPAYPHHHTRLNISYDGNFYGANIPLGYQAQIISAFKYPAFFNIFTYLQKATLGVFLYATLNQKTVKELLMYHVNAINEPIFVYPHENHSYVTPTHHWRRQGYYDMLATVDNPNSPYFFPMPLYTRNIAISLGHISENNSQNHLGFNLAGEYWKNINLGLWQFKIGTAKYMPSGQTFQLFKRKKAGLFGGVKHEVHVSQMQEIDNASGSYLDGLGNIISVANWTYFSLINLFDGKDYFSHKSVLTALGINKNLWPSDGSHTLNMQSLGLMYNKFDIANNPPSNHYGYPNLGRPNDHFQVTPFEAIYIDNEIDPHIKLKDATPWFVDSLNNFILNEVEPWYLGLQNQHLGAQARANYKYIAYRRAKYRIVVGKKVTPTTDPGDYVVEANAELTLKAGEEIHLKPGVHFKAGSSVHLVPEYDACNDAKSALTNHSDDENNSKTAVDLREKEPIEKIEKGFDLYPNPASQTLTIAAKNKTAFDGFAIIDLQGKKCLEQYLEISESLNIDVSMLKKGIYIVAIQSGKEILHYKLIME